MIHVVLVEPEIPPNTGSVGRLCLATGTRLHLIKPLGFSIDDRSLRRAGLDYWDEVDCHVWESFDEFRCSEDGRGRTFLLTTKSESPYWDRSYVDGDVFVFGRETKGLPESLLEEFGDACITIPMEEATRSLNLATSVGIVIYEARRQLQMSHDR